MMIAQISPEQVTTGGGVLAVILGLVIKDYFMERKKTIREDSKVDNLDKQTNLLSDIRDELKKGGKKSKKQHKKTRELLNEVLAQTKTKT